MDGDGCNNQFPLYGGSGLAAPAAVNITASGLFDSWSNYVAPIGSVFSPNLPTPASSMSSASNHNAVPRDDTLIQSSPTTIYPSSCFNYPNDLGTSSGDCDEFLGDVTRPSRPTRSPSVPPGQLRRHEVDTTNGQVSSGKPSKRTYINRIRRVEKKARLQHQPTAPPLQHTGPVRGAPTKRSGPYKRPKRPRVPCPLCPENLKGFRGDHELRRHHDRVHALTKRVWIVRDMSGNDLLAKCKACSH